MIIAMPAFSWIGRGAVNLSYIGTGEKDGTGSATHTYTSVSTGGGGDIIVGLIGNSGGSHNTLSIGGISLTRQAHISGSVSIWSGAGIPTSGDLVAVFASSPDRSAYVIWRAEGGLDSITAVDTDTQSLSNTCSFTVNAPELGCCVGITYEDANIGDASWTGLTEDVEATSGAPSRYYSAASINFTTASSSYAVSGSVTSFGGAGWAVATFR